MGGPNLHLPQSTYKPTMNNHNSQNEASWFRMPQIPPISMPWSVPSRQQPDLVKFTGEKPQAAFEPLVHQKRKLETPDIVDLRPRKQLFTEEKMAQRFQGLQIGSSAGSKDPLPSTSGEPSNANTEITLSNTLDMEDSNNEEPRLIVSDEIKRLRQDPILPSFLLSKMERPTMALILWEPPNRHLQWPLTQSDIAAPASLEDDNNNTSSNNNVESVLDLNQSIDDNPVLEPMDL